MEQVVPDGLDQTECLSEVARLVVESNVTELQLVVADDLTLWLGCYQFPAGFGQSVAILPIFQETLPANFSLCSRLLIFEVPLLLEREFQAREPIKELKCEIPDIQRNVLVLHVETN